MIKNIKFVFSCSFLICLVLIVVVFWTQPSFAKKKEKSGADKKSASSFGMSPPVFHLECHPGEKKTISVKITNDNQVPVDMKIEPVGKVVMGYNTLADRPIASLPPDNLARHIVVESPVIQVPANSYKDVSITLDIPQGLTGTQYVGLMTSDVTAADMEDLERSHEYEKKIGLAMRSALGISIKCQMVGALKFSYELQKFIVTPPQGNLPTKIKAVLKNTGNAELRFFPILILIDSNNKVVARLKGERTSTLIPLATDEVQMAPSFSQIPQGRYKAVLTLAGSEAQLPSTEQNITIGW